MFNKLSGHAQTPLVSLVGGIRRRSKQNRVFPVLLAVCLFTSFAITVPPSSDAQQHAQDTQPPSPSPRSPDPGQPHVPDYAGSEACKTCHEEIYSKQFENTSHYALIKAGKHGCEDCHGPGAAHVETGGDTSKIISFKKLSPSESSKRCLVCHQANFQNSNFSRSAHMQNDIGCLSCHSPHHATERVHLLLTKQPLLCYGCHATQKAEFARPYKHKVDVGLIECSDCHNPHGTTVEHQLRASAGDFAVCVKCHSEKMGPFVYEHVPVKIEGCASCHTPHGSTNPRLLRVSNVNLLCLQCHTPTANNPVPQIPNFHNQATVFQACTVCHTQIHGSNFSDVFFK